MDKVEVRRLALEKRNTLSEADRKTKSFDIGQLLESLELFKNAKTVLFYYSHNSEVETLRFMDKWIANKNFLLPRLSENDTFLALPFSSLNELEKNRFGIPEPATSDENIQKPDIIIVPGVAFDRRGGRIGMGSGYYDRFLADKKDIPRIALAYSAQILDSVPQDPYDESVDLIITEDEVIRC